MLTQAGTDGKSKGRTRSVFFTRGALYYGPEFHLPLFLADEKPFRGVIRGSDVALDQPGIVGLSFLWGGHKAG